MVPNQQPVLNNTIYSNYFDAWTGNAGTQIRYPLDNFTDLGG
jgi:hypothetical protein